MNWLNDRRRAQVDQWYPEYQPSATSTAFPAWDMAWEDGDADKVKDQLEAYTHGLSRLILAPGMDVRMYAGHCWYCGSRIEMDQERCQGCNARSWDRTR